MSNIKFKLTPSFCNSWPLIRVTINGVQHWEQYIESVQTVKIDFELKEKNSIKIEYLNKRQGPDIWDTKLNNQGHIIEDQYCVLSNIIIANSRCDFLTHSLVYIDASGNINSNLLGFMSKIGYYEITFPRDVYKWISDRRNLFAKSPEQGRTSALGYFSNSSDQNDLVTKTLLTDIKNLLNQI